MTTKRIPGLVIATALAALALAAAVLARVDLSNQEIARAFGRQGIRVSSGEVEQIRDDVLVAVREARDHGIGNSKVDFAAVEIAQTLGLDTSPGSKTVNNITAAIRELAETRPTPPPPPRHRPLRPSSGASTSTPR